MSETTEISHEFTEKPGIFTLMKPGYTLDGAFDPEHEDFKCCCCFHIHTGIKVLTVLTGLFQAFSTIVYFVHFDPSSLSILDQGSNIVACLAMLIGVFFWRRFHKWLKVVLLYFVVRIFLLFGTLIFIVVHVSIALTLKMDAAEKQLIEVEELTNLLAAIYISCELYLYLLCTFSIYTEFKYLQGRVKNGLV